MNRAFLVGINAYPTSPLAGCVNDVTDMGKFLVAKCGFAMADVRLLTDSRATKQAIVDRLGWLIAGARKGDRLLFHYSGHGAQMPTRSLSGEVDGLDEVICPVDFDWSDEHTIRDKDFNRLFATVPDGVEFVWISDSCHSGDLWRAFEPRDVKRKTLIPPADINWRLQTALSKGISLGSLAKAAVGLSVALVSGCKSNQTSADAVFNGVPNGALTYYLLAELGSASGLALPLSEVVRGTAKALKKNGYEQEPQIEGSGQIRKRAFLKA